MKKKLSREQKEQAEKLALRKILVLTLIGAHGHYQNIDLVLGGDQSPVYYECGIDVLIRWMGSLELLFTYGAQDEKEKERRKLCFQRDDVIHFETIDKAVEHLYVLDFRASQVDENWDWAWE